jgi:hypothetical protein
MTTTKLGTLAVGSSAVHFGVSLWHMKQQRTSTRHCVCPGMPADGGRPKSHHTAPAPLGYWLNQLLAGALVAWEGVGNHCAACCWVLLPFCCCWELLQQVRVKDANSPVQAPCQEEQTCRTQKGVQIQDDAC